MLDEAIEVTESQLLTLDTAESFNWSVAGFVSQQSSGHYSDDVKNHERVKKAVKLLGSKKRDANLFGKGKEKMSKVEDASVAVVASLAAVGKDGRPGRFECVASVLSASPQVTSTLSVLNIKVSQVPQEVGTPSSSI